MGPVLAKPRAIEVRLCSSASMVSSSGDKTKGTVIGSNLGSLLNFVFDFSRGFRFDLALFLVARFFDSLIVSTLRVESCNQFLFMSVGLFFI